MAAQKREELHISRLSVVVGGTDADGELPVVNGILKEQTNPFVGTMIKYSDGISTPETPQPTYNQDNSNNSGVQQNSQNGPNENHGGMNVSTS